MACSSTSTRFTHSLSTQPLRVYMYRDMMVRFASETYDTSKLTNTLSHLTNTSLNKYAPTQGQNRPVCVP